ncbi:MAG TPA: hypothetical protein VH703_03330 [Solirubrobacterales bacterium]
MEALKKAGNAPLVAALAIAVLAIAFWMLLLSPKREEATKLGGEVQRVEASLAAHRAEVAEGEAARAQFPLDYQKLVVLGKAVPGDGETASLLVQMSGLAERAKVDFKDMQLQSSGVTTETTPAEAPAAAGSQEEPVSATEAAASLLPLGASVGPAGLAAMPYSLTFDGSFFRIADFIKGLDSMVKTQAGDKVVVDGRLLTIDGFSLSAGPGGFPSLTATFGVTTYLTPPTQGLTGGATPASPAGATATPAATRTGGAP